MPFNDSSVDYVEFAAVAGVMQGLADKCLIGCKVKLSSKGSSDRLCDILNSFCQGNSFSWLDLVPREIGTHFTKISRNKFIWLVVGPDAI